MATEEPGAVTTASDDPPLRVLGPVQVTAPDGSAVPLGRQRMRNLLALLAREPGRDISLESLAADLAPSHAEPIGPSSVRGYLSRLRARLAEAQDLVIVPPATEWGYCLETAGADHVELRRLALSAERRARVRDLRGAVDHAEAGLRLWRGRPFEDVDLPALELHRAELVSALLELEDLRFRALLDLGEHERVISEIEVAVERQPLREERTAHLMVARYRAGRQRDALSAVHVLRTRLAEAGLDQPVPSVQRLEAQILAHDAGLDWNPNGGRRRASDRDPGAITAGAVPGSSPTGPSRGHLRRTELPLIGRRTELGRLMSSLERPGDGGPGVVLVAGEGGIGKSRLVEEATRRLVDDGVSVHWGRCVEAEGAPAHQPVVAVLRSLLDTPARWWADVEVGPQEADIALLMPEASEVLGAPRRPAVEGDEHLRARDAMTRWVTLAARRGPLVLCFEDIHWADRSSLLLMTHLARQVQDERVLLLATYRPEEVVGRPIDAFLATLPGGGGVEEIRLEGLPPADVAALATATAGGPCDYVDQLVERTAGNPLFIREITRHLSEAGGPSEVAAAVPDSVLAVLDRRLGRLAPDVVDLVDAVAMTSGGAPIELLSAASSRNGEALVDDLEQAIDAGVLKEQAERTTMVVEVAHPLFRHVAHQRLSGERQSSLHDRLAAGLDPMAARDPETWLGQLAHHAHRAGPSGDPWRAHRACRAAGELAMRRTAYDQAVTHFSHALDALSWCWDPDPAERARLLLACARAYHHAGAADERVEAASSAFAVATAAGERAVAAEAALVHGGARSTYGKASVQTVQLLEQARVDLDGLHGLDGPDTIGLRARVVARLAQESYHVGRYEAADRLSAEASSLAEATGDDRVIAACAEGEVWAAYHPDRAEVRLALTTEMAERAERVDEREWEMLALVWRASACLELGRIADLDRDLGRLTDLAEVVRAPSHLFRAATMTATRAIMAGRYSEGAGLAEAARRIGVEIEPENADHTFAAQMLGMLREQGALAGLMPMVEELADRYRATPGWRCGLAWVFLHAGDEARAAEELAVLAADDFASIPFDLAWLQAHTYLAETACALGDGERGALLYQRLAPYDGLNANIFDIVSNGAVAHYLGALAALLDDPERAEAHLRAAITFNETTDQRPAAARSRLELARVLLDGGEVSRRHEVDDLLAAASATGVDLGLTQLEADIALLGGGRSQIVEATDPSPVTSAP